MKLIDGEALLTRFKNEMYPVGDSWDEGYNNAIEDCIDAINDALQDAEEELILDVDTALAKESRAAILNTLKAVRNGLAESVEHNDAIAYVDGMIKAFRMGGN